MEATAVTQMNVRIGVDLKKAGDEALASIGFSPSEAVRALWQKASKRGQDLEEVSALLRDEPADTEQDDEWVDPFEEGRQRLIEQMKAMGIKDFSTPVQMSYEELYEMAMVERIAERGLL